MTALYRCPKCGHLQYGPSLGENEYKIWMKCEGACTGLFGRKKRRLFVWYSWRAF